jgi:hypothetical protein
MAVWVPMQILYTHNKTIICPEVTGHVVDLLIRFGCDVLEPDEKPSEFLQFGPGATEEEIKHERLNKYVKLQLEALDLLANIGPYAKSATPLLQQLLHDGDPAIRLATAHALWQINHAPEALASVRQFCWESPFLKERLGILMPDMFKKVMEDEVRLQERIPHKSYYGEAGFWFGVSFIF